MGGKNTKTNTTLQRLLGPDVYKSIFDLSPIGVVLIDKKGTVLEANTRLFDWTGYDPKSIKGKNLATMPFLTKSGKLEGMKKFAQRLLGREPEPYIIDFVSKNKKDVKKGLIIAKAVADKKGKIQADLVMIPDVTMLGEIKDELAQSEQTYQALMDNMRSGVAVYGTADNGKTFIFKDFNKAAERLDSIKKNNILGKDVTKVFPGAEKMGVVKSLREVYKTGKPQYIPEAVYEDKVKGIRFWRDNYVYKLPSGEVVAVYNDITKRKEIEEILRKKLEEMDRINKLMIGRELKMVEMKEKIRKLENKK